MSPLQQGETLLRGWEREDMTRAEATNGFDVFISLAQLPPASFPNGGCCLVKPLELS